MSNDLEKFLQQAAERLAQKAGGAKQKKQPRSNSNKPSAGGSSSNRGAAQNKRGSSTGRSQPQSSQFDEPILDAEVIDTSRSRLGSLRESGPDPLSSIDTRPPLAQTISKSDERMLEHVQGVFDHNVGQLKPPSSSLASQQASSTVGPPASQNVNANPKATLIDMLRRPDSLRSAFIMSEIFKRPS